MSVITGQLKGREKLDVDKVAIEAEITKQLSDTEEDFGVMRVSLECDATRASPKSRELVCHLGSERSPTTHLQHVF